MRPGEQEGRDYHFVTQQTFAAMVDKGAFAEWATVHGNRYGTALATLEEARRSGQDLLLDIDCQGAAQLKQSCPDAVFIFILPPSYEELERRLRGRNTDAPEVIAQRLDNARREVRELIWYDYLVVNDDFDRAVEALRSIIVAEGCCAPRRMAEARRLFDLPEETASRN